jgi:hypothetical protein
MPEEMGNERLRKREAVTYFSNNVTVIKWKVKRDVSVLRTFYSIDSVETRKMERKTGTKVLKPTVPVDCTFNMGGFDLRNQIPRKFHICYCHSQIFELCQIFKGLATFI